MFCNDQKDQTKEKVAVAKVAQKKKRGLLNPQKKKKKKKRKKNGNHNNVNSQKMANKNFWQLAPNNDLRHDTTLDNCINTILQ